jgi:chromosome segregation ATPase
MTTKEEMLFGDATDAIEAIKERYSELTDRVDELEKELEEKEDARAELDCKLDEALSEVDRLKADRGDTEEHRSSIGAKT